MPKNCKESHSLDYITDQRMDSIQVWPLLYLKSLREETNIQRVRVQRIKTSSQRAWIARQDQILFG